jgi:hypothetical protein
MKKFLIQPALEHKISKKSLEDISINHIQNSEERKLIKNSRKRVKVKGANSFIAIQPSTGLAYSFIPLIHDNAFFHAKFPNPIHLYFNQAYSNFQLSESLFSNITFKNESNSNMYFIEDSLFNSYLGSKISTIIFLHSTLEAFINHLIPEDFIYNKLDSQGKSLRLNKSEILKKINIKEKLKSILPKLTQINFENSDQKKHHDALLELISIRDELIHLKIKRLENNLDYNGAVESVVNIKTGYFLESLVEIVNFIRPKFLQFEDTNNDFFRFKFEDHKSFKTDISFFLGIIQSNYKKIGIEIPYSIDESFDHMKNWVMQNLEVLRDFNYINSIISDTEENKNIIIVITK